MNKKANKPARPIDTINKTLNKRYKAEKRFKFYGILAIFLSLSFLFLLFVSIISKGYTAFQQTYVQLEVQFDPAAIDAKNLSSTSSEFD